VSATPGRAAPTAALALVVAALASAPAPARAAMEEYSTFDVQRQESDDESVLDHLLARQPIEWRAEWEAAALAFRTGQGCLTSGEWMMTNQLKLRSALGERAQFDLGYEQVFSNVMEYEYLRLGFRFPQRWGTPFAEFTPSYDKSRQDVAFGWEAGADSARVHVRAVFAIEDFFNNLWAWRQTQVGQSSESYEVHPYEPALVVAVRPGAWRAEAGGRWMTPSVRMSAPWDGVTPWHRRTLWGTVGWLSLEGPAAGIAWETRVTDRQVLTTDASVDDPAVDHHDYRREFGVDVAARRALSRSVTAMARVLYQDRAQRYGEGLGPGEFDGLDRVLQLEAAWRAAPTVTLRAGMLRDRIAIERRGTTPYQPYGTRNETRGYIGLMLRFGRLSVQGIEGIELDHEPYPVWGVHDKGSVQLQATF
jgi:hypothetical protein